MPTQMTPTVANSFVNSETNNDFNKIMVRIFKESMFKEMIGAVEKHKKFLA